MMQSLSDVSANSVAIAEDNSGSGSRSGGMVELVLRVAGPCFFLWMQLSAYRTSQDISSRKSTGILPLIPFLSLLVNCIVWTFYGLLMEDMTVLVPNCLGVFTGAYCTFIHHHFSTQQQKAKAVKMFQIGACVVVINTFLFMSGDAVKIGTIGCVLAVCLMASPLSALQTVLDTHSTESMPFITSFAAFCNSMSWSAYGLYVSGDPMIYVPNLLGLAITSIQMMLFAKFGISAASTPAIMSSSSTDGLNGMLSMPMRGSIEV